MARVIIENQPQPESLPESLQAKVIKLLATAYAAA